MHKLLTPALVTLALSATSIAAAPLPAKAAASEPTYSVSTDMRLDINTAAGTARLIAPSGSVAVKWAKRAAHGTYAVSIARTSPSRATYTVQSSGSGRAGVITVLRSEQRHLSGRPHLVNVDAVVQSLTAAAKK